MKKTAVGVVGCGYWGPNLVRNLSGLPQCQMKLICDLSEERLQHMQKLYPEVGMERDFTHMLNGAKLDAVVIATSVRHHYPMAKASLLAGNTPSWKNPWPDPPPNARN